MNIAHAIHTIEEVIAQLDKLAANKEARTVDDITDLLPGSSAALRNAVETLSVLNNGKCDSQPLIVYPKAERVGSRES